MVSWKSSGNMLHLDSEKQGREVRAVQLVLAACARASNTMMRERSADEKPMTQRDEGTNNENWLPPQPTTCLESRPCRVRARRSARSVAGVEFVPAHGAVSVAEDARSESERMQFAQRNDTRTRRCVPCRASRSHLWRLAPGPRPAPAAPPRRGSCRRTSPSARGAGSTAAREACSTAEQPPAERRGASTNLGPMRELYCTRTRQIAAATPHICALAEARSSHATDGANCR